MSVSTADIECATLTYEGSRDYERNDRDGHERRVELRDHRLKLLRMKAEPSDCRIRGQPETSQTRRKGRHTDEGHAEDKQHVAEQTAKQRALHEL